MELLLTNSQLKGFFSGNRVKQKFLTIPIPIYPSTKDFMKIQNYFANNSKQEEKNMTTHPMAVRAPGQMLC